jgi:hypothetical protein
MSTTQLPRVAGWLLRRLTCGPNRESLIGDLEEQFARGRSPWWYWRQVISAILAGVAMDLRDHPRLAIRSLVLTSAVVILWVESTWALYLWVSKEWVYGWVNSSVVLFEFWIPFGGGLCLIWCVGSTVGGWVSARSSREHRAATVVVGVLAQILLALWWGVPFWLHVIGQPARFSVPLYLNAAIVLFGMPSCALLGGLWGADGVPVRQPPR